MYGYINNNKRNSEIIQESRRSCSIFRSRSLFSLKQQKSSIARLRLQGVEETLLCLLKIPTQLYTCGWFNGSTSSTLWFIIRGLFAFFLSPRRCATDYTSYYAFVLSLFVPGKFMVLESSSHALHSTRATQTLLLCSRWRRRWKYFPENSFLGLKYNFMYAN